MDAQILFYEMQTFAQGGVPPPALHLHPTRVRDHWQAGASQCNQVTYTGPVQWWCVVAQYLGEVPGSDTGQGLLVLQVHNNMLGSS
jgi:hypothetical protein